MNTFQRAASKLHALRTGGFDEIAIGRNPGELFFGGFLLLALFIVPPAILIVFSMAGIGNVNPVFAGVVFAVSLLVGAMLTAAYLRNETSTPFKAVQRFMQHALGQDHARAYLLVVDADKDDLPRHLANDEFSFANIERFRDYWNLVRRNGGDWGKITVDATHPVVMLDDDLASVEFAFLDSTGRRGETHTKLAVRVGHEWRIFNGELCGEEELHLGWVANATDAPPIPTSPVAASPTELPASTA